MLEEAETNTPPSSIHRFSSPRLLSSPIICLLQEMARSAAKAVQPAGTTQSFWNTSSSPQMMKQNHLHSRLKSLASNASPSTTTVESMVENPQGKTMIMAAVIGLLDIL